jgi:transcriptional repressor NrdR
MTYREINCRSIQGLLDLEASSGKVFSMKCPYCGHNEDRVLDTREQKDGLSIRRRRECIQCRSRFTTIEQQNLSLPFIVKKDGRREPFTREKVLKGLQAACQKRPVSLAQLESIVDQISAWVMNFGEKEISSRLIGSRLMMELKLLDDVAYVRFASVYRTFKDVQEFVETLEGSEAIDVTVRGLQLSLPTEVRIDKDANSNKDSHATASKRTGSTDTFSN